MAIGAKQITLDVTQFMSGMASSDYANDGGLGTSCTQINPFVTPGVIRSTADLVSKSSNLTGNIIATSEDSQVTLPVNRVLIDDSGAIYSADSSGNLTKQITAGADTYSFGVTDLMPFATNHYATSTSHLVQFNTSSWTRTESYKSFTNSSQQHPLLQYEGFLYAGDGNLLQQLTSGGTWAVVMTLTSSEQIVALGVDPYTGLMLISVMVSSNPTDSVQQKGVVYLYDGYSTKPRRRIITEEAVRAFYPCGGQVYVGMGVILGQWNGQGVTFLRRLTGASLTTNGLPYKHHFANWRHVLLVMDGIKVLAYGEVVPGRKAFYYVSTTFSNQSPNTFTLGLLGNDIVGVSSSTNTYATFNLGDSTSAGTSNLTFNNINFPRPVHIRGVFFVTTGTSTNQNADFQVRLTDEKNSTRGYTMLNSSGATKYAYMCDCDFKLTSLGLTFLLDTAQSGIVRAIIYYDVAE